MKASVLKRPTEAREMIDTAGTHSYNSFTVDLTVSPELTILHYNLQSIMESELTLPLLRNIFKAQILQLLPPHRIAHQAWLHQVITSFGQMSLLIRQLTPGSSPLRVSEQFVAPNSSLRKALGSVTPIIHETYVFQALPDRFCWLLLTQKLNCLTREQLHTSLVRRDIPFFRPEKLILGGLTFSRLRGIYLPEKCYSMDTILVVKRNKNLFFNFVLMQSDPISSTKSDTFLQGSFGTKSTSKGVLKSISENNIAIEPTFDTEKTLSQLPENFRVFRDVLLMLMEFKKSSHLEQTILIEDCIFVQEASKLKGCQHWVDLAMAFNLLASETVRINGKSIMVDRIESNVSQQIELLGSIINCCQFYKGCNVSCFRKLQASQVKEMLQAKVASYETDVKPTFTLLSRSSVSTPGNVLNISKHTAKVTTIDLILLFLKSMDSPVNQIAYKDDRNSLVVQFKVGPCLTIKFPTGYTVSDEELSIILEHVSLNSTKLNLQTAQISDNFLAFMANSRQTRLLSHIDLSFCNQITDTGIYELLSSPYTANLSSINLAGTLLSSESAKLMTSKQSLTEINIDYCKGVTEFSCFLSKIISLSALEVPVESRVSTHLQILSLSHDISVDELKHLVSLSLNQLRIRLIEPRKNVAIVSFFEQLAGKDVSPIKLFAEGPSRYSLRKLNLSGSTLKFKALKPMLFMRQLQSLSLESCYKIGHEVEPLGGNIINISVQNTHLGLEQLQTMLSNSRSLIELNLLGSCLTRDEVIQLLLKNRISIVTLRLGEEQYSNKLLTLVSQKLGMLELHLSSMMEPKKQPVLNHTLQRIAQNGKSIHLHCHPKQMKDLMNKIRKFVLNHGPKVLNVANVADIDALELQTQWAISQSDQLGSLSLVHAKTGAELSTQLLHGNSIEMLTAQIAQLIENDEKMIKLSIRNNRVLPIETINMLLHYYSQSCCALDFRDCLFGLRDCIELLTRFPRLTSLNAGNYELCIANQSFTSRSSRYLKLFLQLEQARSLTLEVQSPGHNETTYITLCAILTRHSTITELSIQVDEVVLPLSEEFWETALTISTLKSVKIIVKNLPAESETQFAALLLNISKLRLQILHIAIPQPIIGDLPPSSLECLSLDFQWSTITDSSLNKSLRNLKQLRRLSLNCSCCERLSQLNRTISAIGQMSYLNSFEFNLEYCPISMSTITDLLKQLAQLKSMKQLQLNLSFIDLQPSELLVVVEELHNIVPQCYIRVYAVKQHSSEFTFNRQELSMKGIDIIV